MPSIQSLKKELRGIRSTQKLTKALRTVAAAKFSKLNTAFGQFAEYGRQCRAVFEEYPSDLAAGSIPQPDAPPLFIVIASNKGFCGSFNGELLKFAREELSSRESFLLIACGRKTIRYFRGRQIPAEREYILHDVPTYQESNTVFDDALELCRAGKASGIYVIYPKYKNMLNQIPVACELFPPPRTAKNSAENSVLCVPDKATLVSRTAGTIFHAMFYQLVLEAALGAQAATLMTMRSAYDAATTLCEQLEDEINRERQSSVTADVIETASGEAEKEEGIYG